MVIDDASFHPWFNLEIMNIVNITGVDWMPVLSQNGRNNGFIFWVAYNPENMKGSKHWSTFEKVFCHILSICLSKLIIINNIPVLFQACEAFLSDYETRSFIRSGRSYDLIILDGAYPECALGLVYKMKVPFMYINTVGFYAGPTSIAGSPAPYSVTPIFAKAFTDNMGFVDRALNAFWHLGAMLGHGISVTILQGVLRRHFGPQMPHVYDMGKNVSFILQNAHFSVSYPRPFLPNVAEIACIHCKESKKLNSVSILNPRPSEWFLYRLI